jgi:hypothetical protein
MKAMQHLKKKTLMDAISIPEAGRRMPVAETLASFDTDRLLIPRVYLVSCSAFRLRIAAI